MSEIPFERVNSMIEFIQCYPIIVKKDKNASAGMSLVLKNEAYFVDKELGGNVTDMDEESEHQRKLVEFVWSKVMERHRNATHAFRFFDTRGKGKIRKGDLLSGMDKLRIKLANEDADKVWQFLAQGRPAVTFNDFCVLGEQKVLRLAEPFALKQLEEKMQESLAQERAAERERIAQDLLEKMSVKSGVSKAASSVPTGKMMAASIAKKTEQEIREYSFGIHSLPSDNMNSIMHNDFHKEFLTRRTQAEEYLFQRRADFEAKAKLKPDTRSNQLKTQVQQAKAKNFKTMEQKENELLTSLGPYHDEPTDFNRQLRNGSDARMSPKPATIDVSSNNGKTSLPPLSQRGGRSVGSSSKHIKKRMAGEIGVTQPYNPYLQQVQKDLTSMPSMPSVQVSRAPATAARRSHAEGELAQMRAQKQEMMRDYMSQKQALAGK